MNPVSTLLKTAPIADRALGRMIAMKEGGSGLSHMTFMQDTLVAWLPKTAVSRSRAELSETSFLEFLESILIYYAMPFFGGNVRVLQKPLEKFVKTFDFSFAKNGLNLGRNQMLAYMGLAVPSYVDAARDNLERVEIVTRLGLILPYLAFGQGFLEKRLAGFIGRRVPDVLTQPGGIKTLEAIAAEAAKGAGKQSVQRALRAKSMLFGIPLAVGVFGTGLGVGLLNRFFTAYRFKKQGAAPASATGNLPAFAARPVASPLQARKAFEQFARPVQTMSSLQPASPFVLR